MNKRVRTALALAGFACAILLLLAPARAQSVYGSIFGTVTDTSGAAVPGATITVTDVSKGTVVNVTSNDSGDYSVPHLIPDVYDLKVTAKGFKSFTAQSIKVEADTAPRIDPTLEVGGATETIQVNADQEPELKTDRADVATVFDQQMISSLPVGDQNFTNLQLLLPGAQKLGWSHAADENPQASQQIQVDGQAFGGTAFELDGTDNQDPILGIIVINPSMDAVTETKITTQNFDAELGKAVSAVVTAQTRSGTNNLHGSMYDFRTGNANLARDPFSQAPDDYTKAHGLGKSIPPGLKNRFGGSIGGPVYIPHVYNGKDRFFFFANTEFQRSKVGTAATDTLPTNLLTETALGKMVGPSGIPGADFSEYAKQLGAAGTIYDTTQPYTGTDGNIHYQPFANNVIPVGRLSTQALNLLGYLEPYTTGIGLGSSGKVNGLDSNYNGSGTGIFNSNQITERVDFTVNDRMHTFERFSRFWDTLTGNVMFGSAGGPGFGMNNYGGNSKGANDSLAVGMDYAVNPRLLTDWRIGYYRYNVIDSKHDQNVEFANQLGIPGMNTGTRFTSGSPGFVLDNVPGGSGGTQGTVYGDGLGVNRCNCPLTEKEDQGQIVNNWTIIRGNHSIKIGADLRYGRNLRVPSDTDRTGQMNFTAGNTSDPASTTQGGLAYASFMLGDVAKYGRYVSTSTNAKEFQKRTFFYGQDTWRVTHKLTLNLGTRYEVYFPETVNHSRNGSLMNLNDGYLYVAGIGGNPSSMGWNVDLRKQFAPRIGAAYQLDPKTVIRAGYGRSFDTGVFGSIFGHVVTQNLPVLANQSVNAPTTTGAAFTLSQGPQAYVFPTVPPDGKLPAPGSQVSPKARPHDLNFPTIDAWNLSVQRAITPTMALTVAYVGNKGTHTLGDGDSSNTNPNEPGIELPGAFSVNGQTLHYDPTVAANTIAANGGVSTGNLLQRYYGGHLAACADPNYATPNNPFVKPGMCGWTNNITFYGTNQNTEFSALQINLQQQYKNGYTYTVNYQWASAFDEQSGYFTWNPNITHIRDSNTRRQQATFYGSYDLPFGRGKQYAANVPHWLDQLIGGYQLSGTGTIGSGLPYSLNYNEACSNVPNCVANGSAPNWPSSKGPRMHTSLTGFHAAGGTGSRTYYEAQTTNLLNDPGTGVFVNPGLDHIGNVKGNTYFGPSFWSSDLAVSKTFQVWESTQAKFRADAFNAFNHINPGNPSGNIESKGTITSEAPGCFPNQSCGPRQIELSLHLQF